MRASWIRYGSEPYAHRRVRRLVRKLLRRGVEPAPRYRTGKFWTD